MPEVRFFKDVQSGKIDDRSGLQNALDMCRLTRKRLVIAKLCRLSRSFTYSAKLLEGDVRIITADSPNASMLEQRVKATVNQEERERISIRTKEALAAKKARGEKLGNPRPGEFRNSDTTNANRQR
ncbi:MAG: recombinase family protein [Endozoicomonas sp.]